MASPNEVADLAVELVAAATDRILIDSDGSETLTKAMMILTREQPDANWGTAVSLIVCASKTLTTSEETRKESSKTSEENAWLALGSGHYAKAEQLAGEMLAQAADIGPDHWNYGNLIHDAHLITGRARLAQGDIDAAESELRSAGETPGSPQLNSFGPDLSFAWELLKLGRVQAATDYFIACSQFWSPHRGRGSPDQVQA